MLLSQFIDQYIINEYTRNSAKDFALKFSILNVEIPSYIPEFLEKHFSQEAEKIISESDIQSLKNELQKIEDSNLHDAIIAIIKEFVVYYFEKYKKVEIDQVIEQIENKLKKGEELASLTAHDGDKHIQLLKLYSLINFDFLKTRKEYYRREFPIITDTREDILKYNIPLGINALMLTNQLPKGLPLYPTHLKDAKKVKIPLKRGIKDGDSYFPYKRIFKLNPGDTGNNTFLATNGKKILYIRGVDNYEPQAVLSSKIATFVSKKHFASERLLSNHLVGSAKLDQYQSVADNKISSARKDYIEFQNGVISGSGIIEEVLNFICETDPNIENLGLSSTDFDNAYLTKIDFDGCYIKAPIKKEKYEQDIITKPYWSLYHGLKHVTVNMRFIDEKLYARLKLSIMSNKFITALAEKAYIDNDAKNNSIEELVRRTELAFNLFMENKNSILFLQKNPNILNEILGESIEYVQNHFEESEVKQILHSIEERVRYLDKQITVKLSITLKPPRSINECLYSDPTLKKIPARSNIDQIDNETLYLIITEIDNYTKNTYTGFFNIFKDKKLNALNQLICEAFRKNLIHMTVYRYDSIIKLKNMTEILSYVLVALAAENNTTYKSISVTDEKIKTLFELILHKKSLATNMEEDTILNNMRMDRGLSSFIDDIFKKMNQFHIEERSFEHSSREKFSSHLSPLIDRINLILDQNTSIKRKLSNRCFYEVSTKSFA